MSFMAILNLTGGTMSTGDTTKPVRREPELFGQTVVIGGSAGIGIETARRVRSKGRKDGADGNTQINWSYGLVAPDPAPQWRSNGSPRRISAHGTKS
jgi:hypothetical protein